jgi:type IX secretion system PorP/SprF family membrane protein
MQFRISDNLARFILLLRPAIFVPVCLTAFTVTAQQRPHYSQYILNTYIVNPAVAGIENYTDVKLSHRHQWAGLEGAPVTTFLTIHTPLKKDDYGRITPTGLQPDGENPRGQAYWQNYEAPPAHSGVGLTILNDRAGVLNRFSASGTFAYHLQVSPNTTLSMGVSAGIAQLSVKTGKLYFGTANPVDPVVVSGNELNKLKPDVSAGLWLYSANWFAGLAFHQIIPERTIQSADTINRQQGIWIPHTFVTAGYRFFLNDDISMLPSVMVRYIRPMAMGIDINSKLQYRDVIWLGAGYRFKDGFNAMTGFNISKTINIGYSYDATTSVLNTVSHGSHEILIGFVLGNRFGDTCPRNIW